MSGHSFLQGNLPDRGTESGSPALQVDSSPSEPPGEAHNTAHAHICMWVCVQSSLTFVTPWTAVCQGPLSMESSRREYWNGSLFPIPQDLPNPAIETVSPASPALVGRLFTFAPPGK